MSVITVQTQNVSTSHEPFFRGYSLAAKSIDYTSQQDFGTRKLYCVSNVTFHAESKYAVKIFPSPTVLYNGLLNY